MKRVALVPLFAFVAIACGSFLAGPDPDEARDAGSGDAEAEGANDATTSEVLSDAPSPQPPPSCPFNGCPEPKTRCEDDDCDEGNYDFAATGGVSQTPGERCAFDGTAAPATLDYSLAREEARTNVVLSFELFAISAVGRAIASVSIVSAAADAEHVVVVAVAGGFQLCERRAGFERCTATLQTGLPQTLHVYGVVTSEDPPNAKFVIAANTCDARGVLDVTAPFPPGSVKGTFGCLPGASGECTIELDDAVLALRAE